MSIHKDINLWVREKNITQEDAHRQHKTANRLLQLLEYQPGVMLADEVGMGKTFVALATAISFVSNLANNKRILILTPSRELKEKWDRDIDTFRDYCICKGSPIKKLAIDKGIETIKELFDDKTTPIITMPLSRLVSTPKEDEMRCYLGAYFRRRGFSATKRREIIKRVLQYDLRKYNDTKVMRSETWFDGSFLDYEEVNEADFKPFDDLIRDTGSEKELKIASMRVRNSLIPKFPFCIIDEAHNYKNSWVKGNRLFNNKEEADTLKGKFKKFLFLTATPFQLGYEELLNIFKMFKSAETCPQNYDEMLNALEIELSNYCLKVEGFERRWHRFSKSHLENTVEFRDLKECNDLEILSNFEDVRMHKQSLENVLRQYIVRNTKDKGYRKVIVGSCDGNSPTGIDIPGKDKPLFYSLLKLQEEMQSDIDVDTKATWLTDSMVTSTYSTLKASKMLNLDTTNHIINKHQKLVKALIPDDNSKHPKVKDVVQKVVERYFLGEKSLVFTFYIETAQRLAEEIRDYIEAQNDRILKKLGRQRPSSYRDYISKNISKADDLKYLAVHENLVLTYDIKSDIDFDAFVKILAKNGFKFAQGKINYKTLLRAYEHHIITRHRDKVPEGIRQRVCDSDYVRMGLRTDEDPKVNSEQSALPTSEDIRWFKAQSNLIKYLTRGPNIWQYHKETLRDITDIELRRSIQAIVIKELLKSDFIIQELAKAKLSETSSDETWIEVICEVYSSNAIFNQLYSPETTKQRVQRWINRIFNEFRNVCDDEFSKQRFLNRLTLQHTGINPSDVASVHGGSDNRTAYFDAFNSPFKPNILVCTFIGSEGIDLQHECSAVFLYDLGWNPSAIEQKIGHIDRIGSKISRELESCKATKGDNPPVLEIYRPFIKGTRDERMHRVLQHREKWFNFILGSGQRLPEDEDGDYAVNLRQLESEEEMIPLPDSIARELVIDLSIKN